MFDELKIKLPREVRRRLRELRKQEFELLLPFIRPMSIREAAARVGCSTIEIRAAIDEGKLRHIRRGKKGKILLSSLTTLGGSR